MNKLLHRLQLIFPEFTFKVLVPKIHSQRPPREGIGSAGFPRNVISDRTLKHQLVLILHCRECIGIRQDFGGQQVVLLLVGALHHKLPDVPFVLLNVPQCRAVALSLLGVFKEAVVDDGGFMGFHVLLGPATECTVPSLNDG